MGATTEGGITRPIPNPAVKPPIAESTAAQGRGRTGRRAHGGCFPFRRAARRAALRRLRGPGGAVAPGALFPFPLVSNVFILCGVQTGLFRTGILSNNTYILVFPCQRGIIRE